ncbi:endonuclease NucS [Microbacterium halotolerans]|uniref:endonuclease NucS n=1 Tax=Microbacterium halotolerans TaxID=246613 RepID=UPI000E6AD86B|nr:endonuclease NucS [Microbacterium halotolerans]
MRLVIAECSVDYTGRLNAHLPLAKRVLMRKGDGSVLIHSDGGSYKPLNWMSPPCRTDVSEPDEELASAGVVEVWKVTHQKSGDALTVRIHEIISDSSHDLGVDPGLIKDGVESDLQRLLAEQVDRVSEGAALVRREFPTAIGPVDLMVRGADGQHIAVEIKRRGDIDGVEQLTRYLDLLGRDPLLTGIRGVFAAQEIKPQARTLAEDRGIECLVLDYDDMKGIESGVPRLF